MGVKGKTNMSPTILKELKKLYNQYKNEPRRWALIKNEIRLKYNVELTRKVMKYWLEKEGILEKGEKIGKKSEKKEEGFGFGLFE